MHSWTYQVLLKIPPQCSDPDIILFKQNKKHMAPRAALSSGQLGVGQLRTTGEQLLRGDDP